MTTTIKSVLVLLGTCLLLFSCNNSNYEDYANSEDYKNNIQEVEEVSKEFNELQNSSSNIYQEKKISIKEQELQSPLDFLVVKGTYRENLLGGKLIVDGKIRNIATAATFKDPVIRVTYYSKSETNLGSEDYTIWEILRPNSEKEFQLKVQNYREVKSIGLAVVKASEN